MIVTVIAVWMVQMTIDKIIDMVVLFEGQFTLALCFPNHWLLTTDYQCDVTVTILPGHAASLKQPIMNLSSKF
jgi:hypothetical protein